MSLQKQQAETPVLKEQQIFEMREDKVISLFDIINVFVKNWKSFVVCCVIFPLFASLAYYSLTPKEYLLERKYTVRQLTYPRLLELQSRVNFLNPLPKDIAKEGELEPEFQDANVRATIEFTTYPKIDFNTNFDQYMLEFHITSESKKLTESASRYLEEKIISPFFERANVEIFVLKRKQELIEKSNQLESELKNLTNDTIILEEKLKELISKNFPSSKSLEAGSTPYFPISDPNYLPIEQQRLGAQSQLINFNLQKEKLIKELADTDIEIKVMEAYTDHPFWEEVRLEAILNDEEAEIFKRNNKPFLNKISNPSSVGGILLRKLLLRQDPVELGKQVPQFFAKMFSIGLLVLIITIIANEFRKQRRLIS